MPGCKTNVKMFNLSNSVTRGHEFNIKFAKIELCIYNLLIQ